MVPVISASWSCHEWRWADTWLGPLWVIRMMRVWLCVSVTLPLARSFLGVCLLELASGGAGSFLNLGLWAGAFPSFWTYVQQLFIEIKYVDPTYLVPGNGEVRVTAGYQCVCVCVFSELLHQSNMPTNEEKLHLGPFCIWFISVTFLGNGIGDWPISQVSLQKKKKRKKDRKRGWLMKKQVENPEAKISSLIFAMTCWVILGK